MRRLADYSYMLGDYKHALSTYEAVKRDFQGAPNLAKHLAGTQEMIGLCAIKLETGRSTVEACLDSAISLYKEARVPYYAERAVMLYYDALKERNLHREAAIMLVKASGEVIFFFFS